MRRGQKQQAAAREDALSNAYHRRYLEVCFSACLRVYVSHPLTEAQVWEAVKKQTAPDERLLIGPFMKLPSRRDYPDYFQVFFLFSLRAVICAQAVRSRSQYSDVGPSRSSRRRCRWKR